MKFKQVVKTFLQFFKCRNNCVKGDPEIDVQEVFNKVIDTGYYKNTYLLHQTLMCLSLSSAASAKVITEKERAAATKEIIQYLEGYLTLSLKLSCMNLPDRFEDCLVIYRNWNNKPRRRNVFVHK